MLGQSIDHRTEVEGGAADPIGQRAAMQLDPGPGEDLALAIQWQMVRVFADQDICEGALGGQAALDQVCGRRCLRHPLATSAARIFGPDGDDDPQLCRHDVQPLGPVFADVVHLTAASRSARFERNTKIVPVKGSSASIDCASAANPSCPLRLCGAPHNRNYAAIMIMRSRGR